MSLIFISLNRYREVLSFTIVEIATSSKPSLKYWHSELVKALVAAEVDEGFCTKLMCEYSKNTEIGELLADVLSLHIQTRRPEEMEFNIPVHIACPPQLHLFLGEVRLHHEEKLWLDLRHSCHNYIPCDDLANVLAGAR